MGETSIAALNNVSLEVECGEFVAVMGPSGSGKSTLLNIIGCLDGASSGSYYLNGKLIGSLNRNEYATIRNEQIGFIFQGFNLLPRTSALENVELPLIYDRNNRIANPRDAALKALEKVGLADRIHHTSQQLSGGEQQRVAIARALVINPSIILADEPTGNLDSITSDEIMELLQMLNRQGITVILVTHEKYLSEYASRIIELHDGVLVRDECKKIAI
ncbi:MAG TPA: ABC transporter ATP-binding protein [Bacteroidales bacterium]|nr:ABC transporter ATP-binding protein [Bacteroidales bacterium]